MLNGGELERIGGDHLQLHAALIALHGFSLFDLVGVDHDGGIAFGTDNSHSLSLRSLELDSGLRDVPTGHFAPPSPDRARGTATAHPPGLVLVAARRFVKHRRFPQAIGFKIMRAGRGRRGTDARDVVK